MSATIPRARGHRRRRLVRRAAGSAQRPTVAFSHRRRVPRLSQRADDAGGRGYVSIGSDWRGSMMANSSRDPVLAGGRSPRSDRSPGRGSGDSRTRCATCHMPMARADAVATSPQGGRACSGTSRSNRTARTAIGWRRTALSCTICHQISDRKLGTPESFSGGFVIDTASASHGASLGTALGPFDVDRGPRAAVTAVGVDVQTGRSAARAQVGTVRDLPHSCTRALGPKGEPVGQLPEQVPFLEWRHSAFRDDKSCQACHMPAVEAGDAGDLGAGRRRATASPDTRFEAATFSSSRC